MKGNKKIPLILRKKKGIEEEKVLNNNNNNNLKNVPKTVSNKLAMPVKCNLMENRIDEGLESVQIFLKCKAISIGSYEYIPLKDVMISYSGIMFYNVPTLTYIKKGYINFNVKYKYIDQFICFGNVMPVLFFFIDKTIADMIRKLIGIQDSKELYDEVLTYRRIALTSDELSEYT